MQVRPLVLTRTAYRCRHQSCGEHVHSVPLAWFNRTLTGGVGECRPHSAYLYALIVFETIPFANIGYYSIFDRVTLSQSSPTFTLSILKHYRFTLDLSEFLQASDDSFRLKLLELDRNYDILTYCLQNNRSAPELIQHISEASAMRKPGLPTDLIKQFQDVR